MCRSISPVHTHWDGDAIFAVATRQNSKPVSENVIGVAAAEVLSRAITCAVDAAKKSLDFPARSDLR
jgi:L-aminopeptidase/D-esterase-like protein